MKVLFIDKLTLFISVLLTGTLAFAMFGCSASNQNNATKSTKTATVSLPKTSEPEKGFDPILGWGSSEHMHDPLIQSTLVKNDDGKITTDIASSWNVSDDGLTYNFKIKDGIKFNNGDNLVATDVSYTLNQIKNSPDTEIDLTSIDTISTTNDGDVTIRLKEPNNLLLYTLAYIGIVPEKSYSSDYGKNPIGSGPFKLTSWKVGEQAVLEKNDKYYGETSNIDRVIVLFADEDASINLAKTGNVDVAYTSATLAKTSIDSYEIMPCKTIDNRGISLPTNASDNPVTGDLAVRQAINYGCDKDRLIGNTLNGYGRAAYSVCDGMPWASDDMKFLPSKEKANSILYEAGWKKSGDYRQKDGVTCEVTLWYTEGDSARQAISYEFAEQMNEIGIKVNLRGASWDEIYKHDTQDLVLWGWGSTTPAELYSLLKSDSESNYAKYESSTIDNHLKKAISATDSDESYKEFKLAQYDSQAKDGVNIDTGASWVWLANVDHMFFVKNGVSIGDQQLQPHGHGWSLLNNVARWTLE